MHYELYWILSLTFASSLASDQPRDFFTKISALIANTTKQVPGTEAHSKEQKAQRLAQARQAVQALDTHLTPNITNIVVASLGTGSTIINVPALWKAYLTHNTIEPELPIIEFGTIAASLTKLDNRVCLLTVFRDQNKLSMKQFICDGVTDEGFTTETAGAENIHPFPARFTDAIRQKMFSSVCKKPMPKKRAINKEGQQMIVRPLDYVAGQGAQTFEVYIPEDTGRCLVASDPIRFNPCRTWFVVSKLKQDEAKVD